MPVTERFNKDGNVSKMLYFRIVLELTTKSSSSEATAVVGDTYTLDCTSKGIISEGVLPTWSTVTDNPLEITGITNVGKAEKVESAEYETEYVIDVYDELKKHVRAGDIFTVKEVYDNAALSKIYTKTTQNCYLIGAVPEGGENNSSAKGKITVQPTGGVAANLPTVTSVTRGS